MKITYEELQIKENVIQDLSLELFKLKLQIVKEEKSMIDYKLETIQYEKEKLKEFDDEAKRLDTAVNFILIKTFQLVM